MLRAAERLFFLHLLKAAASGEGGGAGLWRFLPTGIQLAQSALRCRCPETVTCQLHPDPP